MLSSDTSLISLALPRSVTSFLIHSKGFAEYCAAKSGGNPQRLPRRHHRAESTRPRLPRMRTDQTSGLADAEPFEILQENLARFHSKQAETMLSMPRA